MSAVWLVQPRVKYIWVHLEPIRLKAHLVQAGPGRGRVFPSSSRPWPYCIPSALHVVSVKLHHLEWGHRQTLSLCPHTAHWKKSKYLAEVNRAEMRSLTFLQERSHNTSIRRMSDRAGRATLFHKFFFYSHFSALSSLSSSIDQIMTSETFRMQGKGLWAWDEAILSGPSGSAFRNLINWKGPPKAYPNSFLVLEVCPTVVKELLISRCKHLFLILDKDNARLKEKRVQPKIKILP